MNRKIFSNLLSLAFLVVSLGTVTYIASNPNIRQLINSSAKKDVEKTPAQAYADSKIRQRERSGGCKGAACLAPEIIGNRDNPANQTGVAGEILTLYDKAITGDQGALTELKEKNAVLARQIEAELKKQQETVQPAPQQDLTLNQLIGGGTDNPFQSDISKAVNDAINLKFPGLQQPIQTKPNLTPTTTTATGPTLNQITGVAPGTNVFQPTPEDIERILKQEETLKYGYFDAQGNFVEGLKPVQTAQEAVTGRNTVGGSCSFNSNCGTGYCEKSTSSVVAVGICKLPPQVETANPEVAKLLEQNPDILNPQINLTSIDFSKIGDFSYTFPEGQIPQTYQEPWNIHYIKSLEITKRDLSETISSIPGVGQYLDPILGNLPFVGYNTVYTSAQQALLGFNEDISGGAAALTAIGNFTGLDAVIESSNRLFYQTGLSPEEAEYYRTHTSARLLDATTVGLSALLPGELVSKALGVGTLNAVSQSLATSGLQGTVYQTVLNPTFVKTAAVANLVTDSASIVNCMATQNPDSCNEAAMLLVNPIPGAGYADDIFDAANAFRKAPTNLTGDAISLLNHQGGNEIYIPENLVNDYFANPQADTIARLTDENPLLLTDPNPLTQTITTNGAQEQFLTDLGNGSAGPSNQTISQLLPNFPTTTTTTAGIDNNLVDALPSAALIPALNPIDEIAQAPIPENILQKIADGLPNDGGSPETILARLEAEGIPTSQITVADINKVNELALARPQVVPDFANTVDNIPAPIAQIIDTPTQAPPQSLLDRFTQSPLGRVVFGDPLPKTIDTANIADSEPGLLKRLLADIPENTGRLNLTGAPEVLVEVVDIIRPGLAENLQNWYAKNIQDEIGLLPWLRTPKEPPLAPEVLAKSSDMMPLPIQQAIITQGRKTGSLTNPGQIEFEEYRFVNVVLDQERSGIKDLLGRTTDEAIKSQMMEDLAIAVNNTMLEAGKGTMWFSPKNKNAHYVFIDLDPIRNNTISKAADFSDKMPQAIKNVYAKYGYDIDISSIKTGDYVRGGVGKTPSTPFVVNVVNGKIVQTASSEVIQGSLSGLVEIPSHLSGDDYLPFIIEGSPTGASAVSIEIPRKNITIEGNVLARAEVPQYVEPPLNAEAIYPLSKNELDEIAKLSPETYFDNETLLRKLTPQQQADIGNKLVKVEIKEAIVSPVSIDVKVKDAKLANVDLAGYSIMSREIIADKGVNSLEEQGLKKMLAVWMGDNTKVFTKYGFGVNEFAGDGFKAIFDGDITIEGLKELVHMSDSFNQVTKRALAGEFGPEAILTAKFLQEKFPDEIFVKLALGQADSTIRIYPRDGTGYTPTELVTSDVIENQMTQIKNFKKDTGQTQAVMISISDDIANKFTPAELKKAGLQIVKDDPKYGTFITIAPYEPPSLFGFEWKGLIDATGKLQFPIGRSPRATAPIINTNIQTPNTAWPRKTEVVIPENGHYYLSRDLASDNLSPDLQPLKSHITEAARLINNGEYDAALRLLKDRTIAGGLGVNLRLGKIADIGDVNLNMTEESFRFASDQIARPASHSLGQITHAAVPENIPDALKREESIVLLEEWIHELQDRNALIHGVPVEELLKSLDIEKEAAVILNDLDIKLSAPYLDRYNRNEFNIQPNDLNSIKNLPTSTTKVGPTSQNTKPSLVERYIWGNDGTILPFITRENPEPTVSITQDMEVFDNQAYFNLEEIGQPNVWGEVNPKTGSITIYSNPADKNVRVNGVPLTQSNIQIPVGGKINISDGVKAYEVEIKPTEISKVDINYKNISLNTGKRAPKNSKFKADTAYKLNQAAINTFKGFGIFVVGGMTANTLVMNRDTIEQFFFDSNQEGYYSPTLGTYIVYENGKWYRLDNGEEVSEDSTYIENTNFQRGEPFLLQFLINRQHLTINQSTFESDSWKELENNIRNDTQNDPYNINVITQAVHDNMLYYPGYTDPSKNRAIQGFIYNYSERNLQNLLENDLTVCFEFAAAEQAYLATLGIHSDLGTGFVTLPSGATGGHAFLIITQKDGSKWIADPTGNRVLPYSDYIRDLQVTNLVVNPSIYGTTDPANSPDFQIGPQTNQESGAVSAIFDRVAGIISRDIAPETNNDHAVENGLYAQTDDELRNQTIPGGAGKPFYTIGCGQTAVANILCEYGTYCPTPIEVAKNIPASEYSPDGLTSFRPNIEILQEDGMEMTPYIKSIQYNLTNYMEPEDVLWISATVGDVPHHTYLDGYTIDSNGEAVYTLNDSYFGDGFKCRASGDSSFACVNEAGKNISINADNQELYIIDIEK